jgi:membrane associated rhomboid family serine protease
MFLHNSYRHIVMNVIFGIFIMYEIEYCWRWSILVAFVAGFAANCMAVVAMEGKLLGFSGCLCACIGIQIAALVLHCNYLRQVYASQFYLILMMTVITLLMIIGFTQAGLVHFFGICFGVLFGLALYPRMPEASINENLDKIFKIMAVAFLGLAVMLALIA